MKNLYRFEKFLLEADKADTMGDFVEKFSDRISSIGSDLEKQKEESDKLKKPTGFDQAKGNEFRKWMSENHSDFKDSTGEKLDYVAGKNLKFDNSTIREAYAKYGEEFKKSSTGLDQKTGNEFRKWMSENHSDFKDSSGEPLSYKEGKDFSYNNKTIKEAYAKYGEEWKKSKK